MFDFLCRLLLSISLFVFFKMGAALFPASSSEEQRSTATMANGNPCLIAEAMLSLSCQCTFAARGIQKFALDVRLVKKIFCQWHPRELEEEEAMAEEVAGGEWEAKRRAQPNPQTMDQVTHRPARMRRTRRSSRATMSPNKPAARTILESHYLVQREFGLKMEN